MTKAKPQQGFFRGVNTIPKYRGWDRAPNQLPDIEGVQVWPSWPTQTCWQLEGASEMTREMLVRAEASARPVYLQNTDIAPRSGLRLRSETQAPVHPVVLQALREARSSCQSSYGGDSATRAMQTRLSELFETEVSVWFTHSAAASNALLISSFCAPTSCVLCAEGSAITGESRGSVALYTGGAALHPLPVRHGRIELEALKAALRDTDRARAHWAAPDILCLSNLTEAGTVYTPGEIGERTEWARQAGLVVHMDGRRLASAIASGGASPADLTWRAGIDTLSFGATRYGTMDCEALILFGKARGHYPALAARSARAGQTPAKMRYLACQMDAWLRYDLWLDLNRKTNAMARRVAEIIRSIKGATILHPVEGNMVFARLPEPAMNALRMAEVDFAMRPEGVCRFVCSWTTGESEITRLAQILDAVATP